MGFNVIVTPIALRKRIDKNFGICEICGCIMTFDRYRYPLDNSATLDRMNNEEIMTINNIQIICSKCNRTKSNKTMSEFIEWCNIVLYGNSKRDDEYMIFQKNENDFFLRKWAIGTIHNHKRRKHIVNITIDELQDIAKYAYKCSICGKDIKYCGGKMSHKSATLDRNDNDLSLLNRYNTTIICLSCNKSKSNRSYSELFAYCNCVLSRYYDR